jgi:cyclopropane-fatty-acyl-phospholipid synthase
MSGWLVDDGLLFIHIFTCDLYSYHFEVKDETDWMAKHFFSGGQQSLKASLRFFIYFSQTGTMPHHELLQRFNHHFRLLSKWKSNGLNYSRTLESWLQLFDRNIVAVRRLFRETYSAKNEELWVNRWRAFFIACSELFKYNNGNTWYVTYYLFGRNK